MGMRFLAMMGLYSPKTALWSSNQSSAIRQRERLFFTVQGVVDLRKLGLIPWLIEMLEMWNDLSTEDGTLDLPEVKLAQYTKHGQSEIRPLGLVFPHRAWRYKPG